MWVKKKLFLIYKENKGEYMNLIEFKNVSKSYGTFQALKNINLQIEPGKIYGL